MVRLARMAPGRRAVTGGMALETRLGERARVSVDLDADHGLQYALDMFKRVASTTKLLDSTGPLFSGEARLHPDQGVILRRVSTPESTVWPAREMTLKYISSPMISAAMNA